MVDISNSDKRKASSLLKQYVIIISVLSIGLFLIAVYAIIFGNNHHFPIAPKTPEISYENISPFDYDKYGNMSVEDFIKVMGIWDTVYYGYTNVYSSATTVSMASNVNYD